MKIPEVKKPSEEILRKIQALEDKKGMIAAIEPETGDFFLGKDVLEAFKKARAKYPYKFFYFIRVGYPYAHQLKETSQI